jgi:hypothetical protein
VNISNTDIAFYHNYLKDTLKHKLEQKNITVKDDVIDYHIKDEVISKLKNAKAFKVELDSLYSYKNN